MKRTFVLLVCIMLLFISCKTIPLNKMVKKGAQAYSYYIPSEIISIEEAQSVLRGLGGSAYVNGRKSSDVTVDKYMFKASMRWQETVSETYYQPSYSGFFLGWDYIPVYGGSYQTNTNVLNKEDAAAFNFKEVKDILMGNGFLNVCLSDGRQIYIGSGGAASFQRIADAIFVLSDNAGGAMPPSLGFSYYDSDTFKEKLKSDSSVAVGDVFYGSPAHDAGLQQSDIILEVNDRKVIRAQEAGREIAEAVDKAVRTGGSVRLLVINWETSGVYPYTYKWEKRIIKIKPGIRKVN